MKILNKLPKSNPNLQSDLIKNGWVPMKEPKNVINAILLSTPLMIGAAIISIAMIHTVPTISLTEFGLMPDEISITINLEIVFWLVLLLFSFLILLNQKKHMQDLLCSGVL